MQMARFQKEMGELKNANFYMTAASLGNKAAQDICLDAIKKQDTPQLRG